MLHCPRNIITKVIYSGLFLTAGLVLTTGLAPALAADPTGDWKVADGVANIRVAECNGGMWGVVAWEKVPGGHDINNPDASKRSRPSLGMPILINMTKKPDADQWEGQVYNGKDGQFYSSTIKPVGSDKLEIQGCVLGFLCGGETWTRVAGPIPSSVANSMAKGTPGALPKTGAPKTTGSVNPAAKSTAATTVTTTGQKQATGAQAADPVGDICLLPDIARFAH